MINVLLREQNSSLYTHVWSRSKTALFFWKTWTNVSRHWVRVGARLSVSRSAADPVRTLTPKHLTLTPKHLTPTCRLHSSIKLASIRTHNNHHMYKSYAQKSEPPSTSDSKYRGSVRSVKVNNCVFWNDRVRHLICKHLLLAACEVIQHAETAGWYLIKKKKVVMIYSKCCGSSSSAVSRWSPW